ncbi:response regulator, partial [Desulfovibrio sp. OttesenSCG-928-G11]|nr:response regulator [Desulfovibrio sp. OttesenSCG-928-G11]
RRRERAQSFMRDSHAHYEPHLTMMGIMYFPPEPAMAVVVEKDGKRVALPYGSVILDSIDGRSVGIGDLSFSFIQAIADGREAFISEAKPNAIPGLSPIFMITAPVRDAQGKLLAAFGFGVKLDQAVNAYLARTGEGVAGDLEILDNRGFYVGHGEPALLLNPKITPLTWPLLHHLRTGQGGEFHVDEEGRDEYYVASPIVVPFPMANDWWVLYNLPIGAMSAALRPQLLALVAAVLLGALFVTMLAARSRGASLRDVRQAMLLREAERKSLYVVNAPYGLLILDAKGRIVEGNPAASRFFGYEPEEIAGMPVYDLIPGCPVRPLPEPAIDDMASDEFLSYLSGRHKGGEDIFVSVRPKSLDKNNVMLFLRGVTELVRQQEKSRSLARELEKSLDESERLRHEAETANEAKSRFLANMSHEIRTPMNAVMGMAQLLSRTRLDGRQRGFIDKVIQASRSLLVIVDEILDFSKIEAGRMEIEHVPFAMKDVLESLRTAFARNAEEKGISFTITLDPRVPPSLLGDPARLGQMLSNLTGNAVKFTKVGGVSVTCTMEKLTPGRAFLIIDVEDTGIGVDEEHIEYLFLPFFRHDDSFAMRVDGGTGLGLPISKHLAELMGGILSVRSHKGLGSVFSLSLAFDVDRRARGAGDERQAAALPPVENALAGRCILLVEDIEINQEVAVELLRQAGADVRVAANGKEAVELVTRSMSDGGDAYDVILMDIQMPVMDGYEATRILRSMGLGAPIIAMTAHAMVEERKRCLQAGMDDHIAKPIELPVLLDAILRAMEACRSQDSEA